VYYGKYVFTTPTGPSTPYNEGQTSGAVTAGDAITFSHPTNYPPDASGWLPELNTISQSEILQPVDGLQIYCGDGTPSQYVWNLPNGAICALGVDAHIIGVQTLQPQPLRFGASNVLVTVGGQTALQNEAANGQYDAGIDGGTVECGPNGSSSIEPYSVGILNLVAEEQSGPFFMTVSDCAGVGIYEATPGAQNGSFYGNHIAGANADYSIGVVVEDVPAFREVNNLSVGSIQGTQWFDIAGVYFLANPLTDLGQDTTSIRNIESEAVMDVVKVDNAQAHLDHIEMTSTANRVAVNVVHFGFNRNNPVAEASRAKSSACAIQDDAMGPTCTSGSNKTPGIYSPQQTTQALNGSSYNTQVVELTDVSGGVDYVNVTGAATGNPGTVTVGAAGADANVNLSLTAQGTGKVEAPTTAAADNSTAVATTAYVQAQGYGQASGMVSGNYPKANGSGSATDSGVVAGPYSAFWSTTGSTAATTPITFSSSSAKALTWGISVHHPLKTSNVAYYIAAADNSSNTYDIGIYDTGGNLKAHVGPTAGTSFAPSTGYKALAWTSANLVLQPGDYFIAITCSATSSQATLGYSTNWTAGPNSSESVATGGTLPATMTVPTVGAFSDTSVPAIAMY
jgi:hypothetical protein